MIPNSHIQKLPLHAKQLNSSSNQHINSQSSQNNSQSQSQQQQLNTAQINPQQIQNTLLTLRKLKIIFKNHKLTALKKQNVKVNKLFKKMNSFFVNSKKKYLKRLKIARNQRNPRFQTLQKVGIRNIINSGTINLLQNKNLQNYKQFFQLQKQQNFHKNNQSYHSQYIFQDKLNKLNQLKCYVCKKRFSQIHHFYDMLCIQCGQFNYLKRKIKANLQNLTAVVTGARLKIGFQIALKLLRNGATVFASSRFFTNTFLRYQKQKDYPQWSHRLHIIQCDFTSSNQVNKFIQILFKKCKTIDILINNAAQTIVRPQQFYLKQVNNQKLKLDQIPNHLAQLKKQTQNYESTQQRYPSLFLPQNQNNLAIQNNLTQQNLLIFDQQNSQIDQLIRDQFDQPLDKRQKNSWTQKISDVSLIDCYTTQLINSIVPFHLINRLKPLMAKNTQDLSPSFIINVSSMQGVFNRPYKNSTHPHTNMAKASLNMITRTCSSQFALKDNIYMNSVDTGWVTQQNPYKFIQKYKRSIPLDCVDGAMRVLDPIYQGLNNKNYIYGKFLKDYKQSFW